MQGGVVLTKAPPFVRLRRSLAPTASLSALTDQVKACIHDATREPSMSNQEVFCFFEWRPHRMFQVAVKNSQLQLVHLLLQHLKDKPSAANGDFFYLQLWRSFGKDTDDVNFGSHGRFQ